MNKKEITLSLVAGILVVNGIFANASTTNIEPFDINSIEYIEEEVEIDLGFDTADYLPEGFDPYKMYVDFNAIEYIEEEVELSDFSAFLPEGFDAYSYPTTIEGMHYIDENDSFAIDFDTKKHLPEGFDPYIK